MNVERLQFQEELARIEGNIAFCRKCSHTHLRIFVIKKNESGIDVHFQHKLGRCFTCKCKNTIPAGRKRL